MERNRDEKREEQAAGAKSDAQPAEGIDRRRAAGGCCGALLSAYNDDLPHTVMPDLIRHPPCHN
jgi:hypothetical protein